MRWTVVGSGGMLATDLEAVLRDQGIEFTSFDRDQLDITDERAVAAADLGDVVVNCAAYTAVDQAESDEAAAFLVNSSGAANLARAAAERTSRIIHISTDYVFAGDATSPYVEQAPTIPQSAYGRTKLAGEWAVRALALEWYVVRTAWLYGAHGPCFPKTMARLAAEHESLSVVTDQVGQPTWTVDLADLIVRLVESGAPTGIYHGTSQGEVSWHGFTQEIVSSLGKDPAMVRQTTAAQFQRPAPRPAYSVLAHDALNDVGVTPIGHWRDRWHAAAATVLGL